MVQVNTLEKVFKDKFNFKTEQYEIPPTDSEKSLFNTLQAFYRCYDGPSKLGIIYYGGHAERVETSDGVDLEIFARRSLPGVVNFSRQDSNISDASIIESPVEGPGDMEHIFKLPRPTQPHISFRAIKEQIGSAETDMLIIVDSCFAAGAFTDQPFGGRKCELFCSIAEKDVARAPGQEGSFTRILTTTLERMIEDRPEGFSTSDLFRDLYQLQHKAHKPAYFTQSRFDFGRIWLRPCGQKVSEPLPESKYSIDVRFCLSKSVDMTELNKMVKALQWIPYVQEVKLQSRHGPNDELTEFIRTVYLANRLRPVLARVRQKLELRRARELFRTNSTPPSPSVATSERFHILEPRDVGLFDWSKAQVVTPHNEHLTSDQYFQSRDSSDSGLRGALLALKPKEKPSMAEAPLLPHNEEESTKNRTGFIESCGKAAMDISLSQRARDGLLFFAMGVLAPTLVNWAMHGSALPFGAA